MLKRVFTGIGAQNRQTRTNLPGVIHADRHYSRNCIEHGVIKQSIVRKGAAGALQTALLDVTLRAQQTSFVLQELVVRDWGCPFEWGSV